MDRPIEIIEPRGKQVPQLPPADGLPKEALRRRRRLWIVGLAVIALVVGVEVVLGVVNPGGRTTPGSLERNGGPVLPGRTGLHVDAFVGRNAYVMNLDTGQVRSAVAIPYGYLTGFNNFIPRAGGVFLELSFGRNFVMPNDLQSVRSLSIKGYSAPALRSDAVILITTPPCPPPAHACTSRGNTQEVDVSIRGKVLRSLALDPSASAPVAEGSSGLVVDEGPPDRRLELLDQTHGSVLRSLGYPFDSGFTFAAMAGNDRFVWIGSSIRIPWSDPPAVNLHAINLHVTNLHSGADVVIPNPSNLLPESLAVDPKGDKVAVLWRYPEANNLGVRYRKAFLGIVDLTTRRIQPVPGASHAADPLVWAPRGKWLFFGTTLPPGSGSCNYAVGLSAYRLGARTEDPLSVPKYVVPGDTCGLQMTVW